MNIASSYAENHIRTLEQNDRDDNANQKLRGVSADTSRVVVSWTQRQTEEKRKPYKPHINKN
jgi:hypothetical protein